VQLLDAQLDGQTDKQTTLKLDAPSTILTAAEAEKAC